MMLRNLLSAFRPVGADYDGAPQAAPPQTSRFPFNHSPLQIALVLLVVELVLLMCQNFFAISFNRAEVWTVVVALAAIGVSMALLLVWVGIAPRHICLALLAVEVILLVCERFHVFPFNETKGWTVLIALGAVAENLVLLLLWFLLALIFGLRLQFSIRSLLLLDLVVVLPCCWLAVEKEQARRQKAIVNAVKREGGEVEYDYRTFDMPVSWRFDEGGPPSPPPSYWQQVLGFDFFADAVLVEFKTEVDLRCLEGLSSLRILRLRETTDEGLESVERLTSLEALELPKNVTDAGLAHLQWLANLQYLDLGNTQVTDAGLVHLGGLRNLDCLNLRDTRVTNAGLVHLERLPKLTHVLVVGTAVTHNGARKLHKANPLCFVRGETWSTP